MVVRQVAEASLVVQEVNTRTEPPLVVVDIVKLLFGRDIEGFVLSVGSVPLAAVQAGESEVALGQCREGWVHRQRGIVELAEVDVLRPKPEATQQKDGNEKL